jgi:hypothetical protein
MTTTTCLAFSLHRQFNALQAQLGPADNYGRQSPEGRAVRARRDRLCRALNYLNRRAATA